MSKINWTYVIIAGIAGTLAMTIMGLWIAPLMGLPKMNPALMLAMFMETSLFLGWVMHFMVGIALAAIYAAVLHRLPGTPPVRGMLYALAPWLVAQVIMMPIMGMPLFAGSLAVAFASLLGHLVYGAVMGATYAARVHAPLIST